MQEHCLAQSRGPHRRPWRVPAPRRGTQMHIFSHQDLRARCPRMPSSHAYLPPCPPRAASKPHWGMPPAPAAVPACDEATRWMRLTASRTVSLRIAACMAWTDAHPAPACAKCFAFLHPLSPRRHWWAGTPLPCSMPRAAPASCRRMRVSFGARSGLRFGCTQKPAPHERWREPAMSALGFATPAACTRPTARDPAWNVELAPPNPGTSYKDGIRPQGGCHPAKGT